MSELIRGPLGAERKIELADNIAWAALCEVTERYGDGYPSSHLVPTVAAMAYHNMQHTMNVRNDTRRMAVALGFSDEETAIAVMPASAHDIVIGKARGVMERESADWLVNKMQQAGFPEEDIRIGELAILATEPLFNKDKMIIGQQIELQDYPSELAVLVACSVTCADMATAFKPHGPLVARDLFRESVGCGPFDEPPMDGLMEFQKGTLHLLSEYVFPHPVGERLFGELRREVFRYQMTVTHDLWLGRIASWQQLIERDEAFARQYSTDKY